MVVLYSYEYYILRSVSTSMPLIVQDDEMVLEANSGVVPREVSNGCREAPAVPARRWWK